MEKVFEVPGQGKVELVLGDVGFSVIVEDYGRNEKGSVFLRMKEIGILAKWMAGLEEKVSFKHKNARLKFTWVPESAGFRIAYEEYDEAGSRLKRAGVAPKGLTALKLLTLIEKFVKNSEVVLTLNQKLITKAKGMMLINDQAEGKQVVLSPSQMEELKYILSTFGKIRDIVYDHKGIYYNGTLKVDGIAFEEPEIRVLRILF